MRVSIDAEQLGEDPAEVALEQNGTVLTRTQLRGSGAAQLPLYRDQNQAVPPGRYSITVKKGESHSAIPIVIE